MKKNLMSVLILALLIVNIVLKQKDRIGGKQYCNGSESGVEYKRRGYGGKRGIH